MAKSTAILFLSGIAIALGLAAWQYSLAPDGTLLYTPAPGAKPNYTPSSAVGFFVSTLGLTAVSALVTVLGLVVGAFSKGRFIGVAKQAAFLLIGFGLLCVLTAFTEKLWF
jgi:hypothetical protein